MTTTRSLATRAHIVDVAAAAFATAGGNTVTLDEVATRAGVHRVTLHRQFPGGRDELVLAVLEREAAALHDQLARAVDDAPTATDAFVTAGTLVVTSARANLTLVPLLVEPGTRGVVLGTASDTLRQGAVDVWRQIRRRADDEGLAVVAANDHAVVDHVFRVLLSLVTDPAGTQKPADVRRYLQTFVVPALLQSR